jgi:chromosome segregation ATPase
MDLVAIIGGVLIPLGLAMAAAWRAQTRRDKEQDDALNKALKESSDNLNTALRSVRKEFEEDDNKIWSEVNAINKGLADYRERVANTYVSKAELRDEVQKLERQLESMSADIKTILARVPVPVTGGDD